MVSGLSWARVKRRSILMKHFLRRRPIWCFLCLLTLGSFVILQRNVESDGILGRPTDKHDWLRNSNYLSLFVHPGLESELLRPTNFDGLRQRQEIACFVMSAPANRLARSAIRRTWGKEIKPLFLMGRSDATTMSFLESEAGVFDDIIVEDFVDSYMNLTLKTAFALKHAAKHFPNSSYFLKIDDDVLLNVDSLHKYLRSENAPEDAIIGRKGLSTSPHRNRRSKWYLPRWLWQPDSFPSYIDGPAYLIPGHMVEELYSTALKLPFFTLEDVFFTGFVAKETLKYNLHSNKKFRSKKLPYHHPCLHERFITVHATSPTDMIDLWIRMKRQHSCNAFHKFAARLVDEYNLYFPWN